MLKELLVSIGLMSNPVADPGEVDALRDAATSVHKTSLVAADVISDVNPKLGKVATEGATKFGAKVYEAVNLDGNSCSVADKIGSAAFKEVIVTQAALKASGLFNSASDFKQSIGELTNAIRGTVDNCDLPETTEQLHIYQQGFIGK